MPRSQDPARPYGRLVVFLRWPVLLLWIGLAVGAVMRLPAPEPDGAGLNALVPDDSEALHAEIDSIERFGFPLLSRTVVVQRDPEGLTATEQADVVLRAVSANLGELEGLEGVAGAFPVTNALSLFPTSSEESTTALTYLFFRPGTGLEEAEALASRYADLARGAEGDVVGVTGALPGRLEQVREILDHQRLVEIATVLVILLAVGLYFRAVGAPLLTLGAAGIAYVVASRSVGWGLARLGVALPEELEPLMVVLLLGIVTDYSIFFLDHARQHLRDGRSPKEAARRSAGELVSIVTTAGLVVAAGAASLLAARLETYRMLGPGLALTVVVGLLVSITFVPAAIAVFGRRLFWPSADATIRETRALRRRRSGWRRRVTYAMTNRVVASLVAVVGLAVLVALALNVRSMNLGFSLASALPDGSEPKEAADAAGRGFAPGIISPTMLVLNAEGGSTLDVDQLAGLQDRLASRPGIAGVVGPREAVALGSLVEEADTIEALPDAPASAQEDVLGAVLTPDGRSARMLVILDSEPLGAPAIDTLERLDEDLPSLLDEAGFGPDVQASVAGDTALASETIDQTMHDLRVIGVVVVVVMLLLLALFLRSLVAPLYLLAISALAYVATLGISTWVFGNVLETATTTFFVPFASAVLLVALGSDYNIFLVGRIWDEARDRPLRNAISAAAPDASRAIAVAGVTLAGSFAMLALVPIHPMQQLAFVMAGGILLDTFFVRALLVPAIVAAVGPISAWPGRFRRPGRRAPQPVEREAEEVAAA